MAPQQDLLTEIVEHARLNSRTAAEYKGLRPAYCQPWPCQLCRLAEMLRRGEELPIVR